MRAVYQLLLLLSAYASGCGQVSAEETTTADWQVYRNEQYGYEIRYPDGYELWPTGPEGRRDGASVRIAVKEHSAPAPVLDVHVGAAAAKFGLPEDEVVPDMEAVVDEVEINGLAVRVVSWRWKENREIVFVDVFAPQVLLQFHAAPGLSSMRETVWWEIVGTFRFLKEEEGR
jgi:hypothetical protein